MSTPARKRLMRDLKQLHQDPPAGINCAPYDKNIMLWNSVIFGPDDSPWDGGTFKMTLQFSEDYPNKPPRVRFISRMFHPNIYADGSVCLDILQNQWTGAYDIAAILTSIQVTLFSMPINKFSVLLRLLVGSGRTRIFVKGVQKQTYELIEGGSDEPRRLSVSPPLLVGLYSVIQTLIHQLIQKQHAYLERTKASTTGRCVK